MKLDARFCLMVGAICALLAVVFGAMGAHALKSHISIDMLTVFETGVRYQMYHGLALLLTGILMRMNYITESVKDLPAQDFKAYRMAARLFLIGIVLFSGSLYALALTGIKILGAITPLGGLAFIAAWCYLILAIKNMNKI